MVKRLARQVFMIMANVRKMAKPWENRKKWLGCLRHISLKYMSVKQEREY